MANLKWYETSFRRNLVDMHIDDWDEEFLSRFDAQDYFDCLKRAHIQSPMIYLQSHVGLCNWPTKSARMHKGFRGINKMKRLIELCRAEGMDAVGYYSLIFNNWAYDNHPEWRMRDRNGKSSRESGAEGVLCERRYGILCPNNRQYREFIVTQMEELLGIYEVDGLFLDMAFWPMICHCDACRERYRQETGRDIPGVDWKDASWVQFQTKREEWMGDFARYCTDAAKRIVPGLPVEHNFANVSQSWLFGVNEGVSDASDYTGGDLYGGPYHESFICKLYYEITNNQPFEYMTSRCGPGLADHTTTKSLDSLKLNNYLTLAHHGAMLFIDAIDPRGTLNPKVYDTIGKAFEESIPYEKYMSGRMVSDVAVYFNMESKMHYVAEEGQNEYTFPQMESTVGGAIALTNGNYLYTVLPNCRKEKMLDKKVVIVSEAPFLSDEEIEHFASYVQNGGSLYISGSTNPKLAKKLLGLEPLGYTAENITYIAPTADGQAFFGEMYSRDYPVSYAGRQIKMRNPLGKKVLATITLPYTDPADTKRFAAIHSNPPGIQTDMPSIVYGEYGRGKAIWSAASFEGNSQRAHMDVFIRMVRLLYGENPVLSSTAPYFVQFTLFDDETHGRLLLHAVNMQECMLPVKAGDFAVSLRTDRPIRSVKLLPGETEVEYTYDAGVLTFQVKDIELFKMYALQY